MKTSARGTLGAIGVSCLVALNGAVSVRGEDRQATADRDRTPASAKLTPYIYGARQCASCHDQQTPPGRLSPAEIKGLICQMTEFPIYDTKDKHKLAYIALTGDRGKEMSRLLGYEVKTKEACLNCHSTADRDKGTQLYSREAEGITCVACHGTVAEWVEIHQRTGDSTWQKLDRKTKEDRYGMNDLWDPVRRAETCASCHIGNYAQRKVVTHAMYAAGHPPLPSFEAATFSDAQPRHWQSLAEKSSKQKSRPDQTAGTRNLEQSKLVLVGGLVALRESMKLLAEQAAPGKRPDTTGVNWPDYARYDCASCHHDLRADNGASWRQLRRRGGQPGRPAAPQWPLVLANLAIDSLGAHENETPNADFQSALGTFQQELIAQPFGGADTARAAAHVAQSTDALIGNLNRAGVDADGARKILLKLCKIATETIPDYDSARQIAWAFQVIYRESVPARDPLIEQALADLERELPLTLPPAKIQGPIVPALPDRFKQITNFDPVPFPESIYEDPGASEGGCHRSRRLEGDSGRARLRPSRVVLCLQEARPPKILQMHSADSPEDRIEWIVAHFPRPAVSQIHLALFFGVQRASPDTTEDGDLVSRLIDGAVAIDSLGDRQRLASIRQLERRD